MQMNAAECDTFPKVIKYYHEKYGRNKTAIRHKQYGIWRKFSWQDFYETVKCFSLGLISLGLQRGERVLIIGDNEPQWLYAAMAIQSAGGVFAGGFADSQPAEIKYYIEHSDVRLVIVEDQEQVDKVLLFKNSIPGLKKVIYWDSKGLWSYTDTLLMPFDDVIELGKKYDKENPGTFEQIIEMGKGEDIAQLAYTSGTTAQPKGVLHTHNTLLNMARSWQMVDPIKETDNLLSFMPMGWAAEWGGTIYRALLAGAILNFPEEPETVQADIRELGVSYALISPKLVEFQIREIETDLAHSTALKKLMHRLFMPVGYKVARLKINQEKINVFWKALDRVAYLMLLRQISDRMGYLQTRTLYTTGAIISPESYFFYHAIGVNLKSAYGMTELGGCPVVQRNNDIKVETSGLPLPGIEVRITDGGDVLLRAPGTLVGYHKNPEAYARAVEGGWLYTGDNGQIDADGHLVIFDRTADLMTTSGGIRLSPQYIEGRIRASRYIKETIVFGDNKPFVACLISIDYGTAGKWAEENKVRYTTYADLSQRAEIYDLVRQDLKRVNRELPEGTKIVKYALLHKELGADGTELSRVKQLRRRFVEESYRAYTDALYGEQEEVLVETTITHRAGRTRDVKIPIRIARVE